MKIKLAQDLKKTLESNPKAVAHEFIDGGYNWNGNFFLICINDRKYSKSSATVDFINHITNENLKLDNNDVLHYIREITK